MPATAQTTAGQGSSLSGREQADNYARVALTLDDRTRIIECRDGLQWVMQIKAGGNGAAPSRWRARGFCRTRAALEHLAPNYTEHIRSVLPDRYPRAPAAD